MQHVLGVRRLHSRDSRKIRLSGIPVHIIHGQYDPLATPFFARRVQRRLRCNLTLTGTVQADPEWGLCPSCWSEAGTLPLSPSLLNDLAQPLRCRMV